MLKIKKILFPTNCSEAATKVFFYTLAMAKYFNAEVITLYVSELKVDTMAPSILRYQLQQEEKKKAQRVLQQFIKKFEVHNISIRQEVELGFAKENIAIYTQKNEDIDLIVLGVNDEPPLKKVLWGTTIATIIDSVKTPILVIPKGIVFQDIQNMAYIIPEGQEENSIPSAIEDLAQYFDAKLYITHLPSSKNDKPSPSNYVLLDNYDTALQSFVYNQNLHLLVTCSSARNTLQRIIKYSSAQKIAHKVTIPLLVWKK
jgi:nucleotide-binding universal stress UspA family protein